MPHETPHATTPPPKLLGLEIIRFLSALAVLLWHYQHFFYVAEKPLNFQRSSQPFYGPLQLFYAYGNYGVQLFWCISGFIFFWKYQETIATRVIGPAKFFVLRVSRLYPLHLATLLLTAALQQLYLRTHPFPFVYQANDLRHFLLQLGLAGNWGFQQGLSFNGPSWSVSVEVLVYIAFFLLLRYIRKSFLINLAVIGGYFIVRHYRDWPIVEAFAFFYAGGLSAMAYGYLRAKAQQGRIVVATTIAVVALPAATSLSGVPVTPANLVPLLLAYVPILLLVCAQDLTVPPRLQRVIEAAGNMTYASYLIHFPLQLAIVIAYGQLHRAVPVHSAVFFLSFLGTTLGLSYLIYRFVEMPAQRVLRRTFG